MINKIKISAVSLAIGAAFMACTPTEECYECTASDLNGQAASMSDETCDKSLSDTDKAEFAAAFAVQHNPTLYSIDCADK